MIQLAVKLGYSPNLGIARKNEKRLTLSRTQGSVRYYLNNQKIYSQVVEIIKGSLCKEPYLASAISAHKCSKRHLNVGIVVGKIGVLPQLNLALDETFRTELSASIISSLFPKSQHIFHRRVKGILAAFFFQGGVLG